MTTMVANTFNWIGFGGIANWFKKLDAQLEQHRKTKETMKQLAALSDRELWDIGISRGDIYNVAHGDETLERVRQDNLKTNNNLEGWV